MIKYFEISYLLYLCMYMPRYFPDISKSVIDMYIYIYYGYRYYILYIYIVNHDIPNSPQKDTQKCLQDNIDNIDYICMIIT